MERHRRRILVYYDVRSGQLYCSRLSRLCPAVGWRPSIVPSVHILIGFGSLDTLPLRLLANRPLWDISIGCSAVALALLRTRPPVAEEGEKVGRADGAVAVEVRQVRRRGWPGRLGVGGLIHRHGAGETPSADSGRCVRATARACLDRQSFRLRATRFDQRA